MNTGVVIFGEALVDSFAQGDVPGGAPFNVARHLAAFGAQPLFVTRVGGDTAGEVLRREFARFGLSTAALQTDKVLPSGRVRVHESAGGHRFEIEPESAYDHIDTARALAEVPYMAGNGAFYYGTLALRHACSREACMQLLARAQGLRYLDLNWRQGHGSRDVALQALRGCQMLKINHDELAMLLTWVNGGGAADAAPRANLVDGAVRTLMQASGVGQLIVTFADKGYAAFDAQGRCTAAGSGVPGVRVADTVGAGDAFSAVVLLGHLSGWALALTLERANAFAAFICTQRGAVPEDLNTYADWRRRWGLA